MPYLLPDPAGPLPTTLMAVCAQGSRRYSWVSEEPLSYVSWQDWEPQYPGGCAYVDMDGAWRTTSCDTKLQGAVCGVNGGECPPAGAEGWAGGRLILGGPWATFSILHPHRAPSSPKNKLPRQLSPGAGGLGVDSLPGALLLLPHGAAAGPQGGAAALSERWAGWVRAHMWAFQVAAPLVDTQSPCECSPRAAVYLSAALTHKCPSRCNTHRPPVT